MIVRNVQTHFFTVVSKCKTCIGFSVTLFILTTANQTSIMHVWCKPEAICYSAVWSLMRNIIVLHGMRVPGATESSRNTFAHLRIEPYQLAVSNAPCRVSPYSDPRSSKRQAAPFSMDQTQSRRRLTCCQQLGYLVLHDAQLANEHIQHPVQLQSVCICSCAVCMPGKHDLHNAVKQLDAGGLSRHRHMWILQVPGDSRGQW